MNNFKYLLFILLLILNFSKAMDLENKFAASLQECINSDANFDNLLSLAKNSGWKEAPQKINNSLMGHNVEELKTFFISVDKNKMSWVSMIIQKPEMCSISVSSNDSKLIDNIERNILDSFRFIKQREEKKGVQTKVFFSFKNNGKEKIVSNKYNYGDNNTFAVTIISDKIIEKVKNTNHNLNENTDEMFYACSNDMQHYKIKKSNNSLIVLYSWDGMIYENIYTKLNFMSQKYIHNTDKKFSLIFNKYSIELFNNDIPVSTVNCNPIESNEFDKFRYNF